jgi:translation initiation factor 4G
MTLAEYDREYVKKLRQKKAQLQATERDGEVAKEPPLPAEEENKVLRQQHRPKELMRGEAKAEEPSNKEEGRIPNMEDGTKKAAEETQVANMSHDRFGKESNGHNGLDSDISETAKVVSPKDDRPFASWLRSKTAVHRDPQSQDSVTRNVTSLLNKLTKEKLSSISVQIVACIDKSENEKDVQTLIQVVQLVFEQAIDEAMWSEMYARLCRKMIELISPMVQQDGVQDKAGNPVTGGQLFQKYLLAKCHDEFKRIWDVDDTAAMVAKTTNLEVTKNTHNESKTCECPLYSDEYYLAQKWRRHGLGVVKFIGDLGQLGIWSIPLLQEFFRKLRALREGATEMQIESVCQLLRKIGRSFDVKEKHDYIDFCFSGMEILANSQKIGFRVRFVLQVRILGWLHFAKSHQSLGSH